MSGGRTMWFANDVARHRRALMVELKSDHGPVALAVDTVLQSHAKEQNDAGAIRDGFAAIAQEAGCTRGDARMFIEAAAAIGWLDDLVIDEDGRRFTCRLSGWRADQERGNAAWKKAKQRADDAAGDQSGHAPAKNRETGHVPVEGDKTPPLSPQKGTSEVVVPSEGDMSPSVPLQPPTAQHSTALKEEEKEERAGEQASNGALHPQLTEVLELLQDAPGLVVDELAVNAALLRNSRGDAREAALCVQSWALEGGMRQSSANRLLDSAFRHQWDAEARRDGIRAGATEREQQRGGRAAEYEQTRKRRNAALKAAMTGGTDVVD